MDNQKIKVLRKIQEFMDNKVSSDYESLGQDGIDSGILKVLEKEGFINWGGVFIDKRRGKSIKRLSSYWIK